MTKKDYEGLLETLDILADKKLVKRIKKAEKDVKKGRLKTLEQVEKEMGLR